MGDLSRLTERLVYNFRQEPEGKRPFGRPRSIREVNKLK
jgi:hypothetical protein